MKIALFFWGCLSLLWAAPLAFSQQVVPTVVIDEEDGNSSPINEYSTFKTEQVSPRKFKDPQRQTLSDLVKDQIGVETQTYCANCGAKRLTINGLKGEHTSILIDGLPLHSAISSFYGVDSVPVNGIQEVNVMRGAGASLTNPEAIGGTLDIVTVDPLTPRQSYSTSLTVNDQLSGTGQNHSALVSIPTDSGKLGFTFGGQYGLMKPWDADENNVAESPRRENYSGLLKARFLPNAKNDVSVRLSYADLEILGGPANPKKPDRVRPVPAQETDFEDGSVDKKYIGDPFKITDWVSLNRLESAVHWTHYLSQTATIKWNSGYARQEQQAIYQHGFDYANKDNMFVSDLSLQLLPSDSHILKLGLFYKNQKLRSASEVLFEPPMDLPKDSFNHESYAGYIQDTYVLSDRIEMDFAARVDHVHVNWLELTNEINKTIIAPRYQFRQNFNDHLSQRFSYGLGYRAPLTFFESQHGNNENGYEVNITELEKAHSFVYSLSQNTPEYYVTGGIHYTALSNMAYGYEQPSSPILYQNTDRMYDIWAADLLTGYKIYPWWFVEVSAEFFRYQDGYTEKLPTAAIERRFQLRSSVDVGRWNHTLTAIMIGSRDLSRYGKYAFHYRDRRQFPPPEQPGLYLKDQKAPTFVTFDTSFSYKFKEDFLLSFGVTNIFDYTQAGVRDNPSAWHWHYDHAHFDGLHTWGPNRGREFFLRLSAEL